MHMSVCLCVCVCIHVNVCVCGCMSAFVYAEEKKMEPTNHLSHASPSLLSSVRTYRSGGGDTAMNFRPNDRQTYFFLFTLSAALLEEHNI